jgi:hypothetical protein
MREGGEEVEMVCGANWMESWKRWSNGFFYAEDDDDNEADGKAEV